MLSKYPNNDSAVKHPSKQQCDSLALRDSGLGSLADSANNFRTDAEVASRLVQLPTPRLEGYKTEEDRLQTFRNWPVEHRVKARDVAHAGLIATGNSDRAQCAFCLGTMYNWEDNDDPVQEHFKHFTECALMKYFIDVAINSNLIFFNEPKSGDNVYSLTHVNNNWLSLVSVGLVLKLGYSERCVAAAKVIFLKRQKTQVPKYFSRELLDIVAKLEDEEEKSDKVREEMGALAISQPPVQRISSFASTRGRQEHVPTGAHNVPDVDNDDSLLAGNSLDENDLNTILHPVPLLSDDGTRANIPPGSEVRNPGHEDGSRQSALKENQRLKEITKCHCGRDATNLFIPCRHITTCDQCSAKLKRCNKCNAEILSVMKIYF